MPDPTPDPSPNTDPQPAAPQDLPPEPPTKFDIGEEFGTAKRNLPPAGVVLAVIAVIAVGIAIFSYVQRPKPQGAGSVNFVSAVEVPGQNMVLSAITLTLRNSAEKSLWVRSLKAQLTDAKGHTYEDDAASAVDLDRY